MLEMLTRVLDHKIEFVVVGAVALVAYLLSRRSGRKALKGPLSPEEFRKFKLVEKRVINHNTKWFRFALPNPTDMLNLPIGQHISMRFETEDGKEVVRSYTPVSTADTQGHVDFIIKIYPTGAMSQHVDKLEIGDYMEMRGPKGRMTYKPNMKKNIGMIAGGSGITPMLQLARAVCGNPVDKTRLSLVFANIAERDILVREELEALTKNDNFSLYCVLQEPPANWTQGTGFVSQEVITQQLPPPGPDTLILLCGPGPMNVAMEKHLAALGYSKDMIFRY